MMYTARHGDILLTSSGALIAECATQEQALNMVRLLNNAATLSETPNESALKQFNEHMGTDDATPLERLRFFCSLAMNGQDWMDVEPFFDALSNGQNDVWISASDRLPQEGQRVLYYFKPVGIHAGRFVRGTCQGDALFNSPSGWLTGDVTHWMPLPASPATVSGLSTSKEKS